jgi:hypothetical protein
MMPVRGVPQTEIIETAAMVRFSKMRLGELQIARLERDLMTPDSRPRAQRRLPLRCARALRRVR